MNRKMKRAGFTDIYLNNKIKMSVDRKRVVFYLLVGLAYSLLWLLGNAHKYPGNFFPLLFNNIWRVVYIIILNFIFFEYTVALVLGKKKYIIYNVILAIVFLWIFMMLWSFGLYIWRSIGIGVHVYTALIKYDSTEQELEAQMAYSAGSVLFFAVSRHIYNYIKLKQATQQLLIEKHVAELNYLKSQTNPHFLFNTLNNIYSLARDKSDLAPESILRLSKILRFMLYETGGAYVAIEQELKIITDYIELEKLRYDESLQVNFNYDVEDVKQSVPPLILIPLVENAFKHGVSETRSRPFVDIHLSVNNRQLKFVVKNSTEDLTEQNKVKENIGLSNLRRQLQLLYTDYDLSVQQSNSLFMATLKINLASHV